MDILIFGGTGAMGKHLVDLLSKDKSKRIWVTTRTSRPNSENVNFIEGNAHDDALLSKILKDRKWDAIVDFMAYQTAEFEKKYKIFLQNARQYVFLSSSRVYAESSESLTEQSARILDTCKDEDYLATDEYALAKARQENLLKDSGFNNWTVIRPYITFSENRLQLSCEEKESWLYRALRGRSIVFSKDLAEKYTTFTYGFDVARGIAAIIGKEDALGQRFHITNGESFLWKDILNFYLDAIEQSTGFRPKVHFEEKYGPFMGGLPMQVKYDRLYNRKFDNSSIAKFIDVSSFAHTKESIYKCISEFVKKESWLYINWTYEAYKDRLTKEWISLQEFHKIPDIQSKMKYLLVRLGLFTPKSIKF